MTAVEKCILMFGVGVEWVLLECIDDLVLEVDDELFEGNWCLIYIFNRLSFLGPSLYRYISRRMLVPLPYSNYLSGLGFGYLRLGKQA
jgi:hypothetical protein